MKVQIILSMVSTRNVWDEEPDPAQLLWRYLKTDRFLSFLETGSLYFSPVTGFDDRFEGAVAVIPPQFIDPRYRELDFTEKAFETLKEDTNVSCWHQAEHESDAMWKLYAEEAKGVVICSTLSRMRFALKPFFFTQQAREPENLWIGPVRYVDLTQVRINPSGIQRFFYKHVVFEFEREFRLAFNLEFARLWHGRSHPERIFVSADPKQLIERIILGPLLSNEARTQITEHVNNAGLGDRLVNSILLGQTRYI